MILAAALLFRHAVTFDQAVILILLNVVLDRLVYENNRHHDPQMAVPGARQRIGGGRNCSANQDRPVGSTSRSRSALKEQPTYGP